MITWEETGLHFRSQRAGGGSPQGRSAVASTNATAGCRGREPDRARSSRSGLPRAPALPSSMLPDMHSGSRSLHHLEQLGTMRS